MLKNIQWIFFDLGSTLIDETNADLHRIRDMIAGTDISEEAYCVKRFEMIKKGVGGDQGAIEFFGLTKTPWHSEDELPYPDAIPTLAELKLRGYKLGVIANQPLGTEERLINWGLHDYFDVIAASAELGVAKPDPSIFQNALNRQTAPLKTPLWSATGWTTMSLQRIGLGYTASASSAASALTTCRNLPMNCPKTQFKRLQSFSTPYDWCTFERSFYALVHFCALFHKKETSFVCQGKRGFFHFG